MTLDVKVDVVQSFVVRLAFDDGSRKTRLVALNDLVDVTWNGNGARKHIIGRVAAISANGSNHKDWYIIIDGADDFESRRERFSPYQILDIDILRKADQDQIVKTPLGDYGVQYIRIVKGRLQYSNDGINWEYVKIDDTDIIEDEEGTARQRGHVPPLPQDTIEDEVY